MNSIERETLTAQSNALRSELKTWEKDFSASHNGKKASRDDIKNNPAIAAKYKEYSKTRDILAGRIPYPAPISSTTTSQTPRKRKREDGHTEGNSILKRQALVKTPSKTPVKGQIYPWEVDPYLSPAVVRNLFTPSKKALGPTPQKDGVVLGIFDLLDETSNVNTNIASPSVNKSGTTAMTPRKPKEDIYESIKHSRTPSSTSKRLLLDAFATPLKNRDFNKQGAQTPSTTFKLHFSTPSFLRRDSQRFSHAPPAKPGELGAEISPQAIRVPRKPLVRGLSSILAGLRKIEEDAADEDLEALHEMEAEEAASKKDPAVKKTENFVQVKDSQPRDFLLGGFDDEAKYDTETEETGAGLGPDGKPLKVFKKRGQKRTTRRVRLKPSRAKPQALPSPEEDSDTNDELNHTSQTGADVEDEPDTGGAEQAIPDTQVDEFTEARNFDSDTQSEYTASEGGTRRKRIGRSRKEKMAEKERGRFGNVKKGVRKVTALANQNFKRLKLRNSGAKGGPGVGSRFRRRR